MQWERSVEVLALKNVNMIMLRIMILHTEHIGASYMSIMNMNSLK